MSEVQNSNSRYVFAIFNLISAVFLLVVLGFIYTLYQYDLGKAIAPLVVSICLTIVTLVITIILDKKLSKTEMKARWLIIFPLSIAASLIHAIYYLSAIDITDIGLSSQEEINFIVVLVVSFITLLAVYLIFFAVKNIRSPKKLKIKYRIFASVSCIFLAASAVGGFFIYSNFYLFPEASMLDGNGHNDGPWLTWEDDPKTSMAVTWLTKAKNKSVVYYGTEPTKLDKTFINTDSVFVHHAKLTGLQPDTMYYYSVPEIFEQNHTSNIFNFTTAPSKSAPRAFSFAVFGDVQPTSDAYEYQNQMVADGLVNGTFDFICNTGDLANSGNSGDQWHRLFNSLARYSSNKPLVAAIGNHDWDGSSGSSNWAEMFPYNYPQPNTGRFHSVDYLNAHLVMIDNFEHSYSMSSAQIEWIKSDIRNAKSNGQDWIFVFFHLSLMTTATTGHYTQLQEQLVPVFDENDVDAVFFGHDHHYEHYNYTYGETGNGYLYSPDHTWEHNEIQYFCTGGGGANLEVKYGVLNKAGMDEDYNVEWWDTSAKEYKTVDYHRSAWNSSRYHTHNFIEANYTTGGVHEGHYYYHDPKVELYDTLAPEIGFDYGEQAYQFMQIDIDGKHCTISARYPNGVVLDNGGANPQIWQFSK
jgi:Calcineurin-like phosphoesterase/Purple acid Phosphatase, N-terminal domain